NRSTNVDHASFAHRRMLDRRPDRAACMIHSFFSVTHPLIASSVNSCCSAGISCTAAKNCDASRYGSEKARVESWESGVRGFAEGGRDVAEELGGIGTWACSGAVWASVAMESGKTRVRRARWLAD